MQENINKEIIFKDIKFESLLMILEYIYSNRFFPPSVELAIIEKNTTFICNSNKIILDLFILSDYFQMDRLKQLCEVNLSQTLSHEMLIPTLQIAKTYNSEFLLEFCYWEIGNNFINFQKRKDFKKLEKEDLVKIKKFQYPPQEYIDWQKKYGELNKQ
ncbi:kelch-like protein [Anaeramoeba ignava]|uniref:Kelch-like protein n=1 Tax=Anaeramoeba ignava TaxID=1746090 RepID=A0A9Q0LK65_ANAIG|nr:kelch-like protein [Anaeramoeba ignava]